MRKHYIFAAALASVLLCSFQFQVGERALNPNTAGTVPPKGLWKLCGDSSFTSGCVPTASTAAYDSSGNGYNGTWSGTAAGTTAWYSANTAPPPPYVGTFNGSDNLVDTTYPTNTLTPLSMCAWIYHTHTNSSGTDIPFSRMETFHNSWDGWFMGIGDTTAGFDVVSNGNFYGSGSGTIALNTWEFICGTDDNAGNAKLYINGVLASSGTYPAGPTVYSWTVEIGNGGPFTGGVPSGGHPFTGSVSRVSVYNQALTAAQIAAIYAAH